MIASAATLAVLEAVYDGRPFDSLPAAPEALEAGLVALRPGGWELTNDGREMYILALRLQLTATKRAAEEARLEAVPQPVQQAAPTKAAASLDAGDQAARARATAARLTEATEVLNDVLGDAETALHSLGLFVEQSVPIPGMAGHHLSFTKDRGVWRLALIVHRTTGSRVVPIDQTSRAVRIAAAAALPALLEALIATGDAFAAAAEATAAIAGEAVEALPPRARS